MSSIENRHEELRAIREQARKVAVDTWRTPDELPAEPLDQIAYWLERERLTNGELLEAIDSARNTGAKWWEIGAAMGRTSEAARAFYQYHRKNDSD